MGRLKIRKPADFPAWDMRTQKAVHRGWLHYVPLGLILMKMQDLLNQEKVAVVPGNAFGASGEGFIRCSYASSMENIKEALKRIESFINRHKK